VDEIYNSLKGKRIIVTRSVEQSKPLMRALSEHGAVPVLLPMVSFAPPDDFAHLDRVLHEIHSFDWIFLTSQNALRALELRCATLGLSLKELIGPVRIAAVGPATAEAAQNCGLQLAHVATKHQGVALAEELASSVNGKKVLLPRSDRANQDLVQVLNDLGALVTEVIAYKTLRAGEVQSSSVLDEIERGTHAILFFSPSAVHNLRDLLGPAKFVIVSRTIAFTAIGPITQRALRESGVEKILSAADTNMDALLLALSEYFASQQNALPAGAKRA
jgi:uroporphyrinogen III methyltransferase/synthase